MKNRPSVRYAMCYDLLYTVTLRAASADIRTPDLSESICVRSSVIKLQRACLQRWLHNMTGIVKHGTASRFRILTGLSRPFTGCGWQTLAPAVFHLVTGGDDHILSMQSCVRSPRKTWPGMHNYSVQAAVGSTLCLSAFHALQKCSRSGCKGSPLPSRRGSISEALLGH